MKNFILIILFCLITMFLNYNSKASFKYNDYIPEQEIETTKKNENIVKIEKKLKTINQLNLNEDDKRDFKFVLEKNSLRPTLIKESNDINYSGFIINKINDNVWLFEKKNTKEKILVTFTNNIVTKLKKIQFNTNINIYGKLFELSATQRSDLRDFYELNINFIAFVDEIN